MASKEEVRSEELVAGHAPALKIGGMRCKQHKHRSRTNSTNDHRSDTEEELLSIPAKPNQFINGQVAKGADLPNKGPMLAHEKPSPSIDYRNNNQQKHNIIQQPNKKC